MYLLEWKLERARGRPFPSGIRKRHFIHGASTRKGKRGGKGRECSGQLLSPDRSMCRTYVVIDARVIFIRIESLRVGAQVRATTRGTIRMYKTLGRRKSHVYRRKTSLHLPVLLHLAPPCSLKGSRRSRSQNPLRKTGLIGRTARISAPRDVSSSKLQSDISRCTFAMEAQGMARLWNLLGKNYLFAHFRERVIYTTVAARARKGGGVLCFNTGAR